MAVGYQIPRGTRANLNAKATGATIVVGQIYLITDEARLAVGTSTTSFQALPKQNEDGNFILTHTSTPATPGAGISLYRRSYAGRSLVGTVDSFGETSTAQTHLCRNKVCTWNAAPGTATAPAINGMAPFTALGTLTARTPATTNIATRTARLGLVSGTAAASFAGMYSPVASYTTGGSAASIGGFHFMCRFSLADTGTATGPRMFVGLGASVAAPTNVEPSAANLPNHIGVAQVSGSNNLQMLVSGSGGTLTDLGTSFPANSTSAELYELQIFSPAIGTNTYVGYRLERISTGAVAELYPVTGAAGTAFPSSTTLLAPRMWRTNNALTTAVGIDIATIYTETDN